MKTLYIEGVATHDGPESCVDVRKGGGEALTGERAGWAIKPPNAKIGVPTLSNEAEGNIAGEHRLASRQKFLCLFVSFAKSEGVGAPPTMLLPGLSWAKHPWRWRESNPRPPEFQ